MSELGMDVTTFLAESNHIRNIDVYRREIGMSVHVTYHTSYLNISHATYIMYRIMVLDPMVKEKNGTRGSARPFPAPRPDILGRCGRCRWPRCCHVPALAALAALPVCLPGQPAATGGRRATGAGRGTCGTWHRPGSQ